MPRAAFKKLNRLRHKLITHCLSMHALRPTEPCTFWNMACHGLPVIRMRVWPESNTWEQVIVHRLRTFSLIKAAQVFPQKLLLQQKNRVIWMAINSSMNGY